MNQERTMTTAEAARAAGVSEEKLRRWQREGWLNPASEGEGRQKRISWSTKDVEAARALKDGETSKSAAEAFVDSCGGYAFVELVARARARADRGMPPGSVLLAATSGMRVVARDEAVGPAAESITGSGESTIWVRVPL